MWRVTWIVALVWLCTMSPARAQADAPPMSDPTSKGTSLCKDQYSGSSSQLLKNISETNGGWVRDEKSDTVVVFVHGILSDGGGAWLSATTPCTYWPDLLSGDSSYFNNVDVFVANYYSKADSGTYSVGDAAQQLWTALSSPLEGHGLAPVHRKNVLFLAHSLGGIVVRQMLVSNSQALDRRRIGLVLLGSPSKGSPYAKGIGDWLRGYYSNALLRDLSTESVTLTDLDTRFSRWLGERQTANQAVAVAELFESTFPTKGDCSFLWFFCGWVSTEMPPVVELAAAGNYDQAARRIGNTDHLTLVKPMTRDGGVHQEVRAFFARTFGAGRALFKDNFGSIEVAGTTRQLGWKEFGLPSEWVFTAQWPCKILAGQSTCGPWTRNVGTGFNGINPQENDQGFVVLTDVSLDTHARSPFVFGDVFSPSPSPAKLGGKPIYSSISRSATLTGQTDSTALGIRSMTVQPVIVQATNRTSAVAPKSIPTSIGGIVEISIPSEISGAQMRIRSISGEWTVVPANVATGQQYGVLKVDDVERSAEATKLRLSVWPK